MLDNSLHISDLKISYVSGISSLNISDLNASYRDVPFQSVPFRSKKKSVPKRKFRSVPEKKKRSKKSRSVPFQKKSVPKNMLRSVPQNVFLMIRAWASIFDEKKTAGVALGKEGLSK